MGAILGSRTKPQQETGAVLLPKIRNRHRFLYTAHPLRWEWVAEDAAAGNDGWLPILGRINLIPGVGGVGAQGQTDLAIVQAMKDGWIAIHPSDARLGPYKHYTQSWPSKGRTKVWGSIFDSVSVIGGRARWSHDEAAYRAFRRHLIDSGTIPAIEPEIRDDLIEQAEAKLERMRGRLAANPQNPALSTRIDARRALVEGMRAELAPPKPKPKRKRAPRKPKAKAAAPAPATEAQA